MQQEMELIDWFWNLTGGMLKCYPATLDALTSVHSQLRYHQIPTFGHGTIRRFPSNVSEMKKLAARDFEDILQVRTTYNP